MFLSAILKRKITILTILVFVFISVLFLYQSKTRPAVWDRINYFGVTLKASSEKLTIWPDEDSSDRIINQLLLKVPDNGKIIKIYAPDREFLEPYGDKYFKDANCNVKSCTIVHEASTADAVLIKHNSRLSRANTSMDQIWILFTMESPFHAGFVNPDMTINWTATYRTDSDLVAPYAKWVYYNNQIQVNVSGKNYAAGKTKKVAMFVSNCNSRNNRLRYAKELSKYIDVDIYGACGKLKCSKQKNNCFELLRKDYKFYLAFENSNCRNYITEKYFYNALQHDILPVVMGPPISDYIEQSPYNSFLHVDSFRSPESLAEYLHLLDKNDDLYNSYFYWKGTGEFINTKFFCRLCALLHLPRKSRYYESFGNWWRGDGICRT